LQSLADIEFTSSPVIDLWRAPTNNDIMLDPRGSTRGEVLSWRLAGLNAMDFSPREITTDGVRTVCVSGWLGPRAFAHGVATRFDWQLADDGALELHVTGLPQGDWPSRWPRAGVRFSVPNEFDQVGWYGYGPGEGYPDTRAALRLGRYESSIADLQTPYVYPQENGERPDLRWLELRRAKTGGGLRIEALSTMGFTARPWTSEDLETARHTTDLTPGPNIVVTLDAALEGIGTEACGPGILEQYQLRPRSFDVWVRFRPIADTSAPRSWASDTTTRGAAVSFPSSTRWRT
jgi:beta-galactosidase